MPTLSSPESLGLHVLIHARLSEVCFFLTDSGAHTLSRGKGIKKGWIKLIFPGSPLPSIPCPHTPKIDAPRFGQLLLHLSQLLILSGTRVKLHSPWGQVWDPQGAGVLLLLQNGILTITIITSNSKKKLKKLTFIEHLQ